MDGPARRRRNALAGAALAALAIGIAVGASSDGGEEEPLRRPATPNVEVPPAGEPERAERDPLAGLSLRQQVGQIVVLRFAGTAPPEYVRRAVRERRAAGAILFGDNVVDAAQLRALTRALRRAGRDPIVAVDQEGGVVQRIKDGVTRVPSARSIGRAGSTRRACTRSSSVRCPCLRSGFQ